jgi:hypothetical protein
MDDAQLILAMNDSQLERARRVIDAQLRGELRVRALIAVARAGSPERCKHMLDDVLSAIEGLPEADDCERAYVNVASLLSTADIKKVLPAAERIGEPSGITQVLKMLPHLSRAARASAVELVLRQAQSTHPMVWVDALRATPSGAGIEALYPMLEYALALEAEHGKAQLLAALATRVSERERTRAVNEASAAIADHKSVSLRIRLLLELGDTNAAEWELGQAAHGLDADDLALVVAQIAPRLTLERKAHWVQLALNRGFKGKHVLETLAPVLDAAAALSYLAGLVNPGKAANNVPLFKAMALDKPFVSVNDPAPTAAVLAERIAMQGAADAA